MRSTDGGVHQGGDVPAHPAALQCHLQRSGKDAVRLQDGRAGQAAGQHLRVERFEMFGLQPVQAHVAEVGEQVDLDLRPIAGEGEGPDPRGGDAVEPVRQPGLDGRRSPGGRHARGVSLALDLPDPSHDLAAGPGRDMSAVTAAALAATEADVAVPASRGVAVDRGLAHRGPSSHQPHP